MRFTLTEDHIKLLRRAYVEWQDCETGAPAIDPKQPYGNSCVTDDVAEILGIDVRRCPHCEEALDERDDERLDQLHRETQQALAVILAMHKVKPATYCAVRKIGGPDQWEEVGDADR